MASVNRFPARTRDAADHRGHPFRRQRWGSLRARNRWSRRRRSTAVTTVTVALALLGPPTQSPAASTATPAGSSTVESADGLRDLAIGGFETDAEGWRTIAETGATADYRRVGDAYRGDNAARVSIEYPADPAAGSWAGLTRSTTSIDVQQISFAYRTTAFSTTAVNVVDGSGQTHQYRPALVPDGSWHVATIDDLQADVDHWGGANDGVYRSGISSVAIVPDWWMRLDTTAAPTAIDLDEVTLHYRPPPGTPTGPDVSVTTTTVGNVFVVGSAPSFTVATAGERVDYTVRNADGAVIDQQTASTPQGSATLAPSASEIGWYQVRLVAYDAAGDPGVPVDSTFAIVQAPGQSNASRWGVSTHFATINPVTVAPLIAKGSMGWVRDEAYWDSVETTKGTYDWSRYTPYQQALRNQGSKRVLILSYGNPNYDGGKGPTSPEGIAAFTRYAVAAVDQFGTDNISYEVWNEWNLGLGNVTDTSATAYLALLRSTYNAIKAKYPQATVIGAVTSEVPIPWLTELFDAGGLDLMDAISIHPYVYPQSAEAQRARVDELRQLLSRYDGGAETPVIISEQGWPTGSSVRSSTEQAQAANVVRAALGADASGVQSFINYNLVDDGDTDTDTEQRFGLLHSATAPGGAFTPKPAYVAYAVASRLVGNAELLRSNEFQTDGTTVYQQTYRTGEQTTRAMWSERQTQVNLPATGDVTVVDWAGRSHQLQPDPQGLVYLSVGEQPLFVVGNTGEAGTGSVRLTVADAAAGDPIALTWSVDAKTGPSRTLQLTFAGARPSMLVATGEQTRSATVSLLPEKLAGSRGYTGILAQGGRRIGLLSTAIQIVAPLQVSAVHTLNTAADQVLRITARNRSITPQQLTSLSYSVGAVRGTALADTVVPVGGAVTADVPLTEFTDGVSTRYVVAATPARGEPVVASGSVIPTNPGSMVGIVRATPAVSPAVDLAAMTRIELAELGTVYDPTWAGPSDVGGTFGISWDDDNLYVAARITDDVQQQTTTGADIWSGDSIQIALSAGTPGEATAWHEWGAALTADGPSLWRWNAAGGTAGPVPGGRVSVTRDEGTASTTYVVAMPWSQLTGIDPANPLLSVSLLVNDTDGNGQRGTYEWGRGISNSKDSGQFNAARLLG